MSFVIENASFKDMGFLVDAAAAEGWNPGLSDAIAFYQTDPKGFFIGKLKGKVIGCISAVAYNEHFGFIGFYIVMPEYRGKGYGLPLWNHAMGYLGHRTIGLDGVVAQQDNYKKSGFSFYYNNIRFTGSGKGRHSNNLKPIQKISFDALLEFDTAVFGMDRSRFLQSWIDMQNAFGFAKLADKQLLGYGVIRKCHRGYKIGPIFANNPNTAEEIYCALMAQSNDDDVFVDIPQTNQDALYLVRKHDLQPVFETARMYKGQPPKQQLDKVFGVTSFELG